MGTAQNRLVERRAVLPATYYHTKKNRFSTALNVLVYHAFDKRQHGSKRKDKDCAVRSQRQYHCGGFGVALRFTYPFKQALPPCPRKVCRNGDGNRHPCRHTDNRNDTDTRRIQRRNQYQHQ